MPLLHCYNNAPRTIFAIIQLLHKKPTLLPHSQLPTMHALTTKPSTSSLLHLLLLPLSLTSALHLPLKRFSSSDGPTIWKSPDGGNTAVRFGDAKVYVGDCKPSDVLASVSDNCYDEGFCNSASWSMQCVQGDAASHTITLTAPEGQFQPWIKNGLVEALQAALGTEGVTQKEVINAMSGGGCVGCP